MTGSISRPLALAVLCAALAAGCATAPPPPPPPVDAPPPPPPLTAAQRLDQAARLLGDGLDLPRARALLDGVPPGSARREQLLGQAAELGGDDAAALAAYGRSLALADDDDVRLRRALILERLGRADEAAADLARLRPPPARPDQKKPERKLRPLR